MDPLRSPLRFFLLAMLVLLVGGGIAFASVENLSLGDAFYFTVVTVATVGYGDIHPSPPMGKLLAVILILGGVGSFTESDQSHLQGDIARVYALLVVRWLSYLEHLKEKYPYLFSLAVRLNPFDPQRSAVVR